MYDLAGKVAVITGVGRPRGIGRATAWRFAQEGAHVVLADLGSGVQQIADDIQGVSPDLERVAGEVEAAGAQVLAVPTDVNCSRVNMPPTSALRQRWSCTGRASIRMRFGRFRS